MNTCETCGNEYHAAFQVTIGGIAHTFDSFECAINALAPVCHHCRCRVIGHGVESGDMLFCCANCARRAGVTGLRDQQPDPAVDHQRPPGVPPASNDDYPDPMDQMGAASYPASDPPSTW